MSATKKCVGIINATIVPMISKECIIKNGGLVIYNNKIIRVGASKKIQQICDKIIDIEGRLIIPPFLNAHHHFYQGIISHISSKIDLISWLTNVLFNEECMCSKEDVYQNTLKECKQFLGSGVGYIITQESNLIFDEVVEACRQCKIKVLFGRYCGDNIKILPKCLIEKPLKAISIIKAYTNIYNKNNRLKFSLAPRFLPALTPKSLLVLKNIINVNNMFIQFHINESLSEIKLTMSIFNKLSVILLNEYSLLYNKSILSHVVYLTDNEKNILYKRKPIITISPTSNIYLAGNIAPISEYLNKGLLVTIGLDGFATSQSKTYIEELYKTPKITSYSKDILIPKILISSAAVSMNIFGGGQLIPGSYADILIFDTNTENPWKYINENMKKDDIYSLLLNGEVVYGESIL